MKIIFLDIDGVLNSYAYDRVRKYDEGNIDMTRLDILKDIVDKTGAYIVLTSSWRRHWEKDYLDCDYAGREISDSFYEKGMEIYDKTPELGYRADEIRAWMEGKDIESFVIIDDMPFGWSELSDRFIKTDPCIGRGLEHIHAEEAIEILNKV